VPAAVVELQPAARAGLAELRLGAQVEPHQEAQAESRPEVSVESRREVPVQLRSGVLAGRQLVAHVARQRAGLVA
jgi:hypothetical protein